MGKLPGQAVVVCSAKVIQPRDGQLLILPAWIFLGVGLLGQLQEFFFFGPAVMVKRPFVIRGVDMSARKPIGRLYVNHFVAFVLVKLHEQVGKDMAGSGGKKRSVFARPRLEHISPFFWGTIECKTRLVHALDYNKKTPEEVS